MRRRSKQLTEADGASGAAADALTPLLNADDEDEDAHHDAPHPSGRSAASAQQQQLIVFQQFNLPAFLGYIYRCWQSVFGAVVSLVVGLLPSGGASREAEEVLSLLQTQRLDSLRERIAVPYDPLAQEHQDLLRRLWALTFPGTPCTSLKTAKWQEMGWQGPDPGTDFRGAGLFGLQNLVYFAEHSPAAYRRLVDKTDGTRAEWEYPFAAAGLNITVMLIDLLHVKDTARGVPSPSALCFRRLLASSPTAFEELYCAAYEALDALWLRMKADYMQFNAVLKELKRRIDVALAGRPASLDVVRQRVLALEGGL